jgi:hypothetical protein
VDLVEHADYINQQALGIAIIAGAIKPCRIHPYFTIDLGDQDAEKRAYAMGTVHWVFLTETAKSPTAPKK